MATISEIRAKYPEYNDLSDGALAQRLWRAHYSDMPFKDFADKVALFQKPQDASVGDALIATAKAVPRVVGATAAGMAAFPVAGLAGAAEFVRTGGDLGEAQKAMESVTSVPNQLIETPEERAAMENVGLAFKPLQMAGEGLKEIVRQTPLKDTIAEPIAGTIGEASAMFGAGGIGRGVKARVANLESNLKVMGGETPAPALRPVPIPPEKVVAEIKPVESAIKADIFDKVQEKVEPIKEHPVSTDAGMGAPAEPTPISAIPEHAGEGWEMDRGAIPGEPVAVYKDKVAIIEREVEGKGSVYDLVEEGGNLIKTFSTIGEAGEAGRRFVDEAKPPKETIEAPAKETLPEVLPQEPPAGVPTLTLDQVAPALEANGIKPEIAQRATEHLRQVLAYEDSLLAKAGVKSQPGQQTLRSFTKVEIEEAVTAVLEEGESIAAPRVPGLSGPIEAPRPGEIVEPAPTSGVGKVAKAADFNPTEELPVNQALSEIKSMGGLNRESLRSRYSQDQVTELVKRRPGLVSNNGKATLDEIADMHGFGDGDTLLQEILGAKSKKQYTASEKAVIESRYHDEMKRGVAVGDLKKGDKVVIDGEEFQHKGFDADGNAIIKDGETIVADPFEVLRVDKIEPGKRQYKEETQDIPGASEAETFSLTESPGMVGEKVLPKTGSQSETLLGSFPGGAWEKLKDTKFGKSFREFWNPLSTMPEGPEYMKLRYRTMGDIDRAETISDKIFERTKKFSEDDRTAMFQALDGQIDIDSLPDNIRTYTKMLQTVNTTVGRMLVDRGMLSEKTFAANQGQYIRYLYLKHILGDKFRTADGAKLDLTYLKKRKDLTPEERRAIGWVEDVSVAEPVSVGKPLRDIALNKMQEAIRDNPNWTWQPGVVEIEGKKWTIGELSKELDIQKKVAEQAKTPETEQRLAVLQEAMSTASEATRNMPEDFVQINGAGYGPLDGAFVRKEIARDIKPIADIPKDFHSKAIDTIIDIERKGMAAFKVGKTAFNLPTVVRNIFSNFIQLNMSGIPFYEVPVYYERALSSMLKKDATWKSGQKQGLYKTNWSEGEIREVLDYVQGMKKEGFFGVLPFLQKVSKYYGKIDDVAKLAKFIEQTEKGIGPNDAAVQAQKWGMDYSLAHPAVKWSRRHIVPFGSYFYKIAPLIAEAATQRPWVLAKYAAIPYVLSKVAMEKFNLTDDDWRRLKRDLPEYIRKNDSYMVMPWKSPEGNLQWVNFQYFLPWGGWQQLGQDIRQKDLAEAVSDAGLGNPYLDIYAVLKSAKGDKPPKDPFTGRDVYNALDPAQLKALKTVEWLYNKWAPSMVQREGAAGYTARIGEKDRHGRTVTPEQALGRWVGVNIVAPSKHQAALERYAKSKDLQASLVKILVDPTIPQERKKRAAEDFREKIKELNQK